MTGAMQGTTANRTARRGPAKKRALVRGEPVVRGILAATLEELASAGYRALRIEDVATRAGVNKTTVYRRWPTKEDLVRAALLSVTDEKIVPPNTGSLRGDLIALGRAIVEIQMSPVGQSLVHVFLAEGLDSELMAIARSLRAVQESGLRAIVEGAVARGELAPSDDPMLPFELLGAYLKNKMIEHRASVDEAQLARVVDVILFGVLRPGLREQA
ncbi:MULTISPECIES: TetR/AcrR family transcriptional regulator [Sorangium]|uniref:TetR family transcriptional regulator n=1 Tax=Sorangium cellulosum TaxID=56 RepID=A0A4P2R4X1_SORCE|nr:MULTISPECIES: TetR/AcrR family transcriptional regulator [Sorangium]AUX37691.1 TetR family transcriptional regulator [Sorangium cellulosum]WCQ96979.1 putative HTH-type transcriptional regulator [Sorangium sp. Soce836]